MIESLPLFHRIAGQPVVVTGEGEAAEAKRRLVERAGGRVIADLADGVVAGARIAFVAHEDAAAQQAEAAAARAAGMIVNVPDRPELCDFTVPSILDRTPVLLAIGTGGASAGLAKQLRLRLEALLPQTLGALARGMLLRRAGIRGRFPDAGDRRRAIDAAMSVGGPLDPLAEDSSARIDDWLTGAAAEQGRRVEIVLRSEDPDDLTLREARLLGSADVIVQAPDVPVAVLERARADAARIALDASFPVPERGLVVVLRGPAGA